MNEIPKKNQLSKSNIYCALNIKILKSQG